MRRLALLLMLSLSALLIGLTGAEVVLRVLRLYEPPPFAPTPLKPHLYRAHEITGYALWPSADISYRYPDDNPLLRTVTSNSDGFRSPREFDAPHDGPRILVVGDSFVFGDGVDADERLTEALESRLPGWRVENLGMTGWGVDSMYRATQWIAPRAKPDIVVLCVYTDDFRRVDPYYSGLGYAIPRFALEDGELRSIPYPNPSRLERMRLWQAWLRLAFDRSGAVWRLHEALLDRFRALSESEGFELVLAFLPGREDTQIDQDRRAWLADYGARRGVPFLDLTDVIHGAGVEKTYIEGNWHWSPTGHWIAAKAIHGFLNETGLLSGQPPEAALGGDTVGTDTTTP